MPNVSYETLKLPTGDMAKRRTFLYGAAGALGFGASWLAAQQGFSSTSQRTYDSDQGLAASKNHLSNDDNSRASLSDRAASKGLLYGAAVTAHRISSDASFAACVARECNILVAEIDLKWKALRPAPDQFDFSRSDRLLDFTQRHNMQFCGHTLVWHNGLPNWFESTVTADNAEQFLRTHIQTVVSQYAGKMHSWDVVNEAILPAHGRQNGLRGTPWLSLLGESYIEIAFETAAQADPDAMLVYNDFGLDYDISEEERKRTAVLELLSRLQSRGVPIHALGIQAHLHGDLTHFNPDKLRSFIQDAASMGLKVLITELDVSDRRLPRDIDTRDRQVAEVYEAYLTAALAEPSVIAVLTWGLSDRYTWLTHFQPRSDGAAVRPLPLDDRLQPKRAWRAIADAFDEMSERDG
ncbi:endo-1,4-beta-xylanase [Leptolyngbya sp. FACHB-541]|uniref:endo-1,4-beta-xylanase n=1 Tax=Leptolyngbya sp. FACHB-541 TaxID=2692810 RepID=UPI001F54A5C0|nr:endo-1,4-beta-xylanase [Leptolyngbya sp. FACHB-541]